MRKSGPSPELRRTSDYASMVALGRRAGLETSTLTKVLAAFGYYLGEELVGCACLREVEGVFTVECLAVADSSRGQGLGSSLVHAVEDEARSRGVERLWAVARRPGFS
jgi:N-acetylglutamate synthase-like GNAT family acetyltransferase